MVTRGKSDASDAGGGLGDVRHGFAPVTAHDAAAPPPPLADIAANLVADIKATAESELALIQARAALAGDGVRRAAMWGAIAGGAALIALLAIVFGVIVALVPYVGAVFATLIVGGLLLALAAFAALRARTGAADVRTAFAEQGDNPHWKGEE
ncbi:MAG: phage holin family protein [Sphingopyxis sp.]|nr:phage holin family protein [Sphingopyxis sp.]